MSLGAQYLWLIPLLPLLAAAVGTFAPRSARRFAAGIAIGAMALSFVLSCGALVSANEFSDTAARERIGMPPIQVPAPPDSNPVAFASEQPGVWFDVSRSPDRAAAISYSNFTWFEIGNQSRPFAMLPDISLGWLLDPLGALMCMMVTFVGTLILIFSTGYMKEDPNFSRFFCFLSLFAAGMLGIIVANSLLLIFICWEIVGLASYLLIGFWFHKPEAAAAAKKAFVTTRIGDLGFLLGLLWLYDAQGTVLLYDAGQGLLDGGFVSLAGAVTVGGGLALSTACGLLVFCGAIGKSGQFPLHVWLPDAMEGPTPVSALIHAATMVAAGVFLVARMYPLMAADLAVPDLPLHALTVVAWIGAITALLGAVIAVAQNDIKRILAFSTVSQLGYMMLALGVGSWVAAIFHLLTHAFFKALLFLGAGSVIHAAHHEQDIRRLGGLGPRMKATFATFAIGMMAIAGVPFLFSGFWSKEAILHAAHEWEGSHVPFYVGLVAVVLTAFYMTRLMAEVFRGAPRSDAAGHAHENPRVMTVPLGILAVCSVLLGFLGTPAWPWLQSAMLGMPQEAHSLFEGAGLMGLSILLVSVGIGSGWALYGRRLRASATARDPIEARLPGVFAVLGNRLGFDEFYAATAGRLVSLTAAAMDTLDRWVWGGLVSFLALFAQFSGSVNREMDEGGLNAGFDRTSETLRGSGRVYSGTQTGETHSYLRLLVLGFSVLALFLVALGGAGR
jgi:NADH-quinone oxidoreductase subunit L